jgi:acetylornithine/N-succinyldiaminopimelate aminotransferase
MGVYSRTPLAFERGEGARLYTTDGDAYLDCMAGIAVNALGHANPILVKALKDQAEKLWHVSNIFTIPGQERLAKALTDATFADEVFFTNSGSEAIECAIKTARKYHWSKGQPERIDIIGFEGSFHGRTLGAINASGNANYLEGFGPLLPGFVHAKFGDLDALKALVGPTTAAIILEPVQGEGGARSWPDADLSAIRQLCNETGTLLIYDEIQCGLGRTGKLFAHEWAGEAGPDIMALAKALGGGFPLGACLATAEAAKGMTAGTHGSTFGGNPLAMAAGNAVLDVMLAPGFLEGVRRTALVFKQKLAEIKDLYPSVIAEVRGEGLLVGLRAMVPNAELVDELRAEKTIVAAAGDNVVRLLPPLVVSEEEIAEAVRRIERACGRLAKAHKGVRQEAVG